MAAASLARVSARLLRSVMNLVSSCSSLVRSAVEENTSLWSPEMGCSEASTNNSDNEVILITVLFQIISQYTL